ncbi:MAG TPA: DUF3574 domain-containing protein [Xanthobacteraceae bacterium]|jgi:hypothetical protein
MFAQASWLGGHRASRALAHPTALAIILALTGSNGAGAQALSCHAGQTPREVAEVLFGRKIGDRLGVSETQWARFVDREISPRFPDGLTVLDAKGEWRDTARNTIVHEPSKLVEIVLPGKPDDVDQLNRIADAYKSQFRQQSVGIVIRAACVSF